ncbi:MAG: RHS repeat-associated core domain-containing protein [Bacteroidales bacterium]|nr:RHS repeat-associated core domain-containing protein [Bacteroidales bacterium]
MTNLNYILRDHLGSLNYVLDKDGGVVQEVNFDAWGRRRNPHTWTYYENNDDPPELMFSRGFTSHEHLDEFQLINMNGRIYDPIIARFLSPDPIVQLPEYSQNFNRYSYVLNNPLRFTDPSGFLVKADTTGGNKSNPYGILNFPADKKWFENEESSFDVEDIQKGKAANEGDCPNCIPKENWAKFSTQGGIYT